LIPTAIGTCDVAALLGVINTAADDPCSNVILKPVVDAVAEQLGDLSSNTALLTVGYHLVNCLGQRMSQGLEHADFLTRWALFTVHVADEVRTRLYLQDLTSSTD
jgi:hypothetical protein